jgi:hypothetical protein
MLDRLHEVLQPIVGDTADVERCERRVSRLERMADAAPRTHRLGVNSDDEAQRGKLHIRHEA